MSIANNSIEVGDTVRIRWPEMVKKTSEDSTFIVMGIPIQGNNEPSWWTFKGSTSGVLRIVTVRMVIEVLT